MIISNQHLNIRLTAKNFWLKISLARTCKQSVALLGNF